MAYRSLSMFGLPSPVSIADNAIWEVAQLSRAGVCGRCVTRNIPSLNWCRGQRRSGGASGADEIWGRSVSHYHCGKPKASTVCSWNSQLYFPLMHGLQLRSLPHVWGSSLYRQWVTIGFLLAFAHDSMAAWCSAWSFGTALKAFCACRSTFPWEGNFFGWCKYLWQAEAVYCSGRLCSAECVSR